MIEKQLTMEDGTVYRIGFKEVGSDKAGLECHILKAGITGTHSIYMKFFLKGLNPDYKKLAISTIFDYTQDQHQKRQLQEEQW